MGGIDASTFRASELLPGETEEVASVMADWRETGFWYGTGNKAATFALGLAISLGRPVAVVEKSGESYLNPVRVYGARDGAGFLLRSDATPSSPETIPTFVSVPFSDLLAALRSNPKGMSVIEYNGTNHFSPWLYEPLHLREDLSLSVGDVISWRQEIRVGHTVGDETWTGKIISLDPSGAVLRVHADRPASTQLPGSPT